MIVRDLELDDIEKGRLDALLEKRLRTIPRLAKLEKRHVYEWLEGLWESTAVQLVAEDGSGAPVGLFVAIPAHLLGAPVPIMTDMLTVSLVPEAMVAMVAEAERRAVRAGCKSMLLTCETQSAEAGKRWGARFGARLVAMSLFKEV